MEAIPQERNLKHSANRNLRTEGSKEGWRCKGTKKRRHSRIIQKMKQKLT
jgi:hypothetical protein